MIKLIDQIVKLEQISSELEPNALQRNQLVQEINQYTNTFIDTIDDTTSYDSSDVELGKLNIGNEKRSMQQILQLYAKEVVAKGIKPASGGHLGYIPGGGIYGAAIADFLAAVTNEYSGMYYASPGAVTIENELLNWMKEIFHYPKTATGNLTSGGSIANLIAMTAARDKHKIKGNLIDKSVIYLSQQVHHCIYKALRIIGLEDVIIRHLPLDDYSRIIPQNLENQIAKDVKDGLNPFLIVASAGTTDTGAVDPLDEIGVIAHQNDIWYHIDAAYGGFFMLCEDKKHLFRGIERSDSMAVDPHKGLFLPYGLGAVLVKDKGAVYHSHHYVANYMQDTISDAIPTNPADVSPELSKHFRGLRLWLPLQLHGIKPFIACLEEKLLLTTYFRGRLDEIGFNLGPIPDLSVSYFWYSSQATDPNVFNKKLLEFIHHDGRVFLSSTTIDDLFVIRIAILAFRTKIKTIDKAISMIIDCLDKTNSYFCAQQ